MQVNRFSQKIRSIVRKIAPKNEAPREQTPSFSPQEASRPEVRDVSTITTTTPTVEEASHRVAQSFARGACTPYPRLQNIPDEMSEALDTMACAHGNSEVARNLVEVARGSRLLAPAALGALFDGVEEQEQLVVGLSMLANWAPSGEIRPEGKLSHFPTRAADSLLRAAADVTGDEALRGALTDNSAENLRQLAREVLSGSDIDGNVVLGRAMVPLTDGILKEMGTGGDPEQRGRLVGSHYEAARRLVSGGKSGGKFQRFIDVSPDGIARREQLWPQVRAEYTKELPELRSLQSSGADTRARAALSSGHLMEGADAVANLVGEPFQQLFQMEKSTRGQGSILRPTGSYNLTGDTAMARVALSELAFGDGDDTSEILAGAGARLNILVDRGSWEPPSLSEGYQKRSQALMDALSEQQLTPAERVVLNATRERVNDRSLGFLYLSQEHSEGPEEALLRTALVAADSVGSAHDLLGEIAGTTTNSLERSLLGLSSPDSPMSQDREATLASTLLLSRTMEPEKAQNFLRMTSLHLIANKETYKPDKEAYWQLLNELGFEGTGTVEEAQDLAKSTLDAEPDSRLEFIADARRASKLHSQVGAEFREQGSRLYRSTLGHDGTWPKPGYASVRNALFPRSEQDETFQLIWSGRPVQLELNGKA